MSLTRGWPAAISEVRIYELAELPALKIFGPSPEQQRSIGQYWEYIFPAAAFWSDPETDGPWISRLPRDTFYRTWYSAWMNLIKSMRFRGDNCLAINIFRYCAYIGLPGSDSTPLEQDPIGLLGRMFAANGLSLYLSSEFYNTAQTLKYSENNRRALLDGVPCGLEITRDGKPFGGISTSKNINPFAPGYLDILKAHFQRIARRYKNNPGIKGIINSWYMLWVPFSWRKENLLGKNVFLKTSYDDLTIKLFEEWSGIKVPVSDKDPERFRKRFDWLTSNTRDKWVEFKNLKYRDMHRQLSAAVKKVAPGWEYLIHPKRTGMFASDILKKRLTTYNQLIRDSGYDPALYKQEKDIIFCGVTPLLSDAFNRYRFNRNNDRFSLVRSQFQSPEYYRSIDMGIRSYHFFHNFFYEYFRKVKQPWLYKSICLVNYTEAADNYTMNNFACATAYANPMIMNYVWCDVQPMSGNEDIYRRAAANIRALPKVVFNFSAPPSSGHAVVRYAAHEKKRYFYVVNPTMREKTMKIKIGGGSTMDLSTGKELTASDGVLKLSLRPYDIRSFQGWTTIPETIDEQNLPYDFPAWSKNARSVIAESRKLHIRTEQAEKFVAEVEALLAKKDPEADNQAFKLITATEIFSDLKNQCHMSESGWPWLILGRFPNRNRTGFDKPFINEKLPPDLKKQYKSAFGRMIKWREIFTRPGELILHDIYGSTDNVAAYACLGLKTDQKQDVIFSVQSDDGVKMWLNGKLIHENKALRQTGHKDKVKAELKPGFNLLMFKVDTFQGGGGGFALLLDILDPAGRKAKNIMVVPANTRVSE